MSDSDALEFSGNNSDPCGMIRIIAIKKKTLK